MNSSRVRAIKDKAAINEGHLCGCLVFMAGIFSSAQQPATELCIKIDFKLNKKQYINVLISRILFINGRKIHRELIIEFLKSLYFILYIRPFPGTSQLTKQLCWAKS